MKTPICLSLQRLALACASLLLWLPLSSQTIVYSENFESGGAGSFSLNTPDLGSTTTGYNDWVVNNAYSGGSGTLVCLGFPFTFTVNNSPTQPAAVTNSPSSFYLHILADAAASSNIFNSNYQPADGTCGQAENYFAKMAAPVSTLGLTGVTLSFYWMGTGSNTSYGEVHYSTNGGTSWTLVTSPVSQYAFQGNWTQQTISLPAFDNQASLLFGFRFVNGISTTGTDPAFSIDEIVLSGTGCSAVTTTASAEICNGDSIFLGGAFQTQSGTYTDSLLTGQGCDSLVNTTLVVNSAPTIFVAAAICDGDSFFAGGAWQTTAGLYNDQFSTSQGCDSTIITNLMVSPTYSSTASAAICEGDSIFLGGSFQTTAGSYVDSFQTALGCDSLEITVLTVSPSPETNAAAAICQGDSILLGGAFQTSAGSYVDVFQTAQGCDSTVTTALTVTAVDTAVSVTNNVLSANASPAAYQWIDCNTGMALAGETGQSFTASQSGSYAVVVSANGCSDTSSCRNVVVTSSVDALWAGSVSLFPNPAGDRVSLALDRARPQLRVRIVNALGQVLLERDFRGAKLVELDTSGLPAGMYSLVLEAGTEAKVLALLKR